MLSTHDLLGPGAVASCWIETDRGTRKVPILWTAIGTDEVLFGTNEHGRKLVYQSDLAPATLAIEGTEAGDNARLRHILVLGPAALASNPSPALLDCLAKTYPGPAPMRVVRAHAIVRLSIKRINTIGRGLGGSSAMDFGPLPNRQNRETLEAMT